MFSITLVSLTNFPHKCQWCPQPGSKCCLGRSTAKSSFLSHLFSILSNSCVITKGVLEGGRKPHTDNFRLRSLCGNGRREAHVYIDHLGMVEGQRKGGREVYHVRFIAGHKLPSFYGPHRQYSHFLPILHSPDSLSHSLASGLRPELISLPHGLEEWFPQ